MRRLLSVALSATVTVAAGLVAITVAAPASASPGVSGTFHAVTPTRLLDTRTPNHASIPHGGTLPLTVTGGVVPAGASAVVLTVTATSPTAGGFLTVYPDGAGKPNTSNLNFIARSTVPNLVLTPVGSGGKIDIYNGSSGGTDVLIDVSGYLTGSATPDGQGAVGLLPAPHRVLDTRHAIGAPTRPIPSAGTVTFGVTGGGVPAGVSAVVVNVTAVTPAASGYIAGYASGAGRPAVSNLNFAAGRTVANLAVLPVGADGKVTLYNGSSGATNMLADVAGYVLASDPVNAGTLGSLVPTRLLDTRHGIGAPTRPLAAAGTLTLKVEGVAGVPLTGASSVVLNVTATRSTRSGHLTVYSGSKAPTVSNVNYSAGQTVPDLVVAPVSSSGTVTIYNGSSGSVDVLADVSGYVQKTDPGLPATSVSRYIRNITGADTDAQTLNQEGCSDAHSGSALVLLDIGAQSNTNSPASANGVALSPANPGVRLTALDPPVRVTYTQLENAIKGYLDGLACAAHGAVTVAVGTSNDGDWTAYPVADKADDWAGVVNTLRSYVTSKSYSGVTIAGASDIEAGFGSTAKQARDWLAAFLTKTSAPFIENGSLDGCPTTYGSTAACVPVAGQTAGTWTIADYVALTKGLSPTRISVLPQIYVRGQQVQWSIVTKAAGGLTFAGALTENAACGSCSFTPAAGWATLYHAISTVVSTPVIPQVSDLQVDSTGAFAGVRASQAVAGRRAAVPALGA